MPDLDLECDEAATVGGGELVCSLDPAHTGPHYDSIDHIWWNEDTDA
jgi:hypothetical protein